MEYRLTFGPSGFTRRGEGQQKGEGVVDAGIAVDDEG